MFGNPETTTGGNALKFYASVRLDIRKIAVIKDGDEATGNRVKIKVVKNKLAPPFKQVELEIEFGQGFDSISETIEIATDLEVINKSGSWYSYNHDKLGQGKEQVKNLLKDNEDLLEEITEKIKLKLKSE
jgi:recombination protein RecA